MYRAFNLTYRNWSNISSTGAITIHNSNTSAVRQSLESFLKDGIIDGGALSEHWFPTIKADVFISHSHKDETDAIKCASWLKDNFGLTSFIDSSVWGYANDLLKIIDDQYCLNPDGENYSYNKRNHSTSHVHMMLSVALNEMLDACECVFFLNSPHSITSADSVSETKSPWLFYELSLMRTIRRTKPDRLTTFLESFGNTKAAALEVKYPVPLKELTPLRQFDRAGWEILRQHSPPSKHSLDLLYEIAPEST